MAVKTETANINTADLAEEIAALRRLTVKDLRRRHVELFGEEGVSPLALDGPVTDPQHFTRKQAKRIHRFDVSQLERL